MVYLDKFTTGYVAERPWRSRPAVPLNLPWAAGLATLMTDMALIVGCAALGRYLSDFIRGDIGANHTLPLAVFVYVIVAGFMLLRGGYTLPALMNLRLQLLRISLAFAVAMVLLLLSVFCLKTSTDLSRINTFFLFGSGWLALAMTRCLMAGVLHRSGVVAQQCQPIVIFADPSELMRSDALQRLGASNYDVVRVIDVDPRDGDVARHADFLRDAKIQHVFLLISWSDKWLVDKILASLQVLSIPVSLLPDFRAAPFMTAGRSSNINNLALHLRRAPLSLLEQRQKRALDIVLSLVALLLLSLPMLGVALAIWLTGGRPIFFRQMRNGLDGRPFSILKFRTMRVMDNGADIPQAKRDDQRVTAVGRFLRKLNLDELPQLLNVLRGDMSLVGPRPHAVAHNNEYASRIENYLSRHRIKPGMTGWAQINGFRGETNTLDKMADRVDYDLRYVNNWSLTLDAQILLRTLVLGIQATAY